MAAPLASTALLTLALAGAAATCTALVPGRRLGWGNVAWFLASLAVVELALFHLMASAVVALVLVAHGALDDWTGRVGFALVVASWPLLAIVQWRAGPTAAVLEAALERTLGPEYAARIPPERRRSAASPLRLPELLRPFGGPQPGIERLPDIPYAHAHERQRLDVYRPAGGVRGAPVLVQIHGGGWTMGAKDEQGLPLMRFMAARGWVCCAIGYRLCPGQRFPVPLVDCKRALAWIRAHVAEYGGDPRFVAVTGGSAGAHLAALLALTPRVSTLQPGFEAADTRVAACVPLYGVYDFLDRERARDDGGAMTRWLARTVMPGPPVDDRRLWDLASPIAQVNVDAPPFFVLHGTHDSLSPVEEARAFVLRLREVSRRPVAYAELPGAQHAWDLFRSVRAEHTVRAVARFLEWARAEAVRETPVARERAGRTAVVGLAG